MSDSARFAATYAEYNKVLRTWFVAFGVGAPGSLLLSEDARSLLRDSACPKFTLLALTFGVATQIGIAVLNKYVAWCNVHIELKRDDMDNLKNTDSILKHKYPFIYRIADLTESIWIDLIVDVITAAVFAFAIWNIIGAVV